MCCLLREVPYLSTIISLRALDPSMDAGKLTSISTWLTKKGLGWGRNWNCKHVASNHHAREYVHHTNFL